MAMVKAQVPGVRLTSDNHQLHGLEQLHSSVKEEYLPHKVIWGHFFAGYHSHKQFVAIIIIMHQTMPGASNPYRNYEDWQEKGLLIPVKNRQSYLYETTVPGSVHSNRCGGL